jgi:hypothetical protein
MAFGLPETQADGLGWYGGAPSVLGFTATRAQRCRRVVIPVQGPIRVDLFGCFSLQPSAATRSICEALLAKVEKRFQEWCGRRFHLCLMLDELTAGPSTSLRSGRDDNSYLKDESAHQNCYPDNLPQNPQDDGSVEVCNENRLNRLTLICHRPGSRERFPLGEVIHSIRT